MRKLNILYKKGVRYKSMKLIKLSFESYIINQYKELNFLFVMTFGILNGVTSIMKIRDIKIIGLCILKRLVFIKTEIVSYLIKLE